MKIMIVSDIHGYNTYMNKFIDIVEKEYPDKIIFLGLKMPFSDVF